LQAEQDDIHELQNDIEKRQVISPSIQQQGDVRSTDLYSIE
jgi:hypothetical protein